MEEDVLAEFRDRIRETSKIYPKINSIQYSYGTAGFRDKADVLSQAMFRIGLLTALRSKYFRGEYVGIMITASHNPEEDNGVKIIDPNGDMLEEKWEEIATRIANCDNAALEGIIKKIISEEQIPMDKPAKIGIAMDTRKSGPKLKQAIVDGATIFNTEIVDFQILTTPQLHYLIHEVNTFPSFYLPSSDVYCASFSETFLNLMRGLKSNSPLKVDCANGVGSKPLNQMMETLSPVLSMELFNSGNDHLNYKCGADYVKSFHAKPEGLDVQFNCRYASLDGDADRIVYFMMNSNRKIVLLDGDRISALLAALIQDLCQKANINLKIRIIQTAYANGASTHYFEKVLNLPVSCTQTGVKYLHREAVHGDHDIAIYFEANGHGTVLFKPQTLTRLVQKTIYADAPPTELGEVHNSPLNMLTLLPSLINQTVGDAISNLLVVEFALAYFGYSLQDWIDHTYGPDLSNRQLKVHLKDKSMFIPDAKNADRTLLSPSKAQMFIDDLLSKMRETHKDSRFRAFVRPSGTENVLRIYSEAISDDLADRLAISIAQHIFDHYEGVGNRPE